MKQTLLFFSICIALSGFAQAQSIAGIVSDAENNEVLIGATIRIKNTQIGTATDVEGKFSIPYSGNYPVSLEFSYVGYFNKTIEVKSATQILRVNLDPDRKTLGEVEITDIRVTQKQKQAPLTVETLDNLAIRETPAPNFYEGLANLKGVDISSASIGFKVINTRGFNSTSPVRSLQLIDGVDNQAPGLNFSLGNFLGAPELDVQKVELIAGASSSFFGPNAFNGAILMQTKDPFLTPGFSASIKGGERHLFEGSARWAQVLKGKGGKERWAYKINLFYLRADDWRATNYLPTPQSPSAAGNPGGWDAVNIYGDEYQLRNDRRSDALKTPGLGVYYRTGYQEESLVNYNTRNVKSNMALHYKINDRQRLIYAFNFGYGTTVYQGDNRFSLKDIVFVQNRLEWREENRFFVRAYATHENAGNSYDAYRAALILQETAKNDVEWSRDYANYWNQNIDPRVRSLPGFPPFQAGVVEKRDSFLYTYYYDSLVKWHQMARNHADNYVSGAGQNQRFSPGTAAFDSAFNAIISRKTTEGGARFFDRSALYHLHAEYQWDSTRLKWSGARLTVGGNARLYTPRSEGTIFLDTNGRRITNMEAGFYAGLEKLLLHDKLKATVTLRVDKNQNFPVLASPAASLVYNQKDHVFRLSFSSAIRNPTLTDQYFNLNVGRATLIGNISGYDNLADPESYIEFLNSNPRNPSVLRYFRVDAVRPERVKTLEAGYRTVLNKKLFIDFNIYHSWYTDFLGYKVGIALELDSLNFPSSTRILRVTANSPDMVTTQGASLGFNYYFKKYLNFNGNYTWNQLNMRGSSDPIIPAFNTPRHKFNVGISGRDVKLNLPGKREIRHLGYSLNARWVEGFTFEGSPQFTGDIPAYYQLDAQLSWLQPVWKTTFKLGASNLTDNKVLQVYGGPLVGRMLYFSATIDLDDWK